MGIFSNASKALPRGPLPIDVPGFATAERQGLIPNVSFEPPARLIKPTAKQHRYPGWLSIAPWLVLPVALVLPPLFKAIVVIGVLVTVGIMIIGGGKFYNVLIDELQLGYTTVPHEKSYWISTPPAHLTPANFNSTGQNVKLTWDLRGCWVIAPDGSILGRPNRSYIAPGLYPSPHSPGERELWTGAHWTYIFPDRKRGTPKPSAIQDTVR